MAEGCNLDRFVRAQAGIFPTAISELTAGQKSTHWMWFIFPQVLGLGLSANARAFALSGKEEARAYLAHPLLGSRLLQCTEAMLDWAGTRSATDILGPIDALKFRSSMTLFETVAPGEQRFADALEGFYEGRRDEKTLELLGD